MKHAPMDTEYFRTTAINHHAVLSIAMTLADDLNAKAMKALLPVFANEMKDSKFYTDNAVGSVELNGGQGAHPTSFNELFVLVLRPAEDNHGNKQTTWTRDQEEFFQDVWPIVQRNGASLTVFLVNGAKHIHDPRFLQLLDRSDEEKVERMMLAASSGKNMAVLEDLATHISAKGLDGYADKLLPGRSYQNGDSNGMEGLTEVFNASEEGRSRVIALMNRFESRASIDDWRQEFFHRQLALFDKQEQLWSMTAIAETIGVADESAVLDEVRRWSKIHLEKDVNQVSEGLDMGVGSFAFSKCVHQALRSHCAPVVDAMGEVFRIVGPRSQNMPYVFRGPLRSVEAYQQTLLTLQSHGHDLNGTSSTSHTRGYSAALKFLSQEPNSHERDAKLAALLDLGVKPTDEIAKGIINATSRNRWKAVIASHSAREAAHNLINGMNLDDAKAPAP